MSAFVIASSWDHAPVSNISPPYASREGLKCAHTHTIDVQDPQLHAPVTFALTDLEPTAGLQNKLQSRNNGSNGPTFRVCEQHSTVDCPLGPECADAHVNRVALNEVRSNILRWLADKEHEFGQQVAQCAHTAVSFKIFCSDLKEIVDVPASSITFTRGLFADPGVRTNKRQTATGGAPLSAAAAAANSKMDASNATASTPTACGLFASDPALCKWGKWCNQAHIDPQFLSKRKQVFSQWAMGHETTFNTMPSDALFLVHDPVIKRSVDIPRHDIAEFTRGLFQQSSAPAGSPNSRKAPSLCLLFQKRRCTAGACCNQIHVRSDAVSAIRMGSQGNGGEAGGNLNNHHSNMSSNTNYHHRSNRSDRGNNGIDAGMGGGGNAGYSRGGAFGMNHNPTNNTNNGAHIGNNLMMRNGGGGGNMMGGNGSNSNQSSSFGGGNGQQFQPYPQQFHSNSNGANTNGMMFSNHNGQSHSNAGSGNIMNNQQSNARFNSNSNNFGGGNLAIFMSQNNINGQGNGNGFNNHANNRASTNNTRFSQGQGGANNHASRSNGNWNSGPSSTNPPASASDSSNNRHGGTANGNVSSGLTLMGGTNNTRGYSNDPQAFNNSSVPSNASANPKSGANRAMAVNREDSSSGLPRISLGDAVGSNTAVPNAPLVPVVNSNNNSMAGIPPSAPKPPLQAMAASSRTDPLDGSFSTTNALPGGGSPTLGSSGVLRKRNNPYEPSPRVTSPTSPSQKPDAPNAQSAYNLSNGSFNGGTVNGSFINNLITSPMANRQRREHMADHAPSSPLGPDGRMGGGFSQSHARAPSGNQHFNQSLGQRPPSRQHSYAGPVPEFSFTPLLSANAPLANDSFNFDPVFGSFADHPDATGGANNGGGGGMAVMSESFAMRPEMGSGRMRQALLSGSQRQQYANNNSMLGGQNNGSGRWMGGGNGSTHQ